MSNVLIFFYCFQTGEDIDDPANPGQKIPDTPGPRVMLSEWNNDSTVICPRCNQKLLFDGDILYQCDPIAPHFVIGANGPKGHLFRYDMKGYGYTSARYQPPQNGKPLGISIQEEYERILKAQENDLQTA